MPATRGREITIPRLRDACRGLRYRVFPPRCSRSQCTSHRLTALWSPQCPVRFQDSWFCSSGCAEPAVRSRVEQLMAARTGAARHPNRIPLGLILLSRGDLSEGQLQAALEAQRTGQPRRIGEWVQILNFANEQQVLAGLGMQWAIPVLSTIPNGLHMCARLLPVELRRDLRLVPVRFVETTRELYVATSASVDYVVLHAIEQMLDCRVQPCLVGERVMSKWVETSCEHGEDPAQQFERVANPSEIVRITSSYAARLSSDDLRIVRCGPHIWVRLSRRNDVIHLVFRLAEAPAVSRLDSPELPAAV